MAVRNWSAARAGAAGWAVACSLALTPYAAGGQTLAVAHGKAVPLALFILYIIWSALALYHVVAQAGAFAVISRGVASLTSDRTMQALLLAWVFASFLQGVTGFGVPVAVVAPLLVGLGFTPIVSVVAASVGHAWAVSFGSVGSAILALHAVTDVAPAQMTLAAAMLLAPVCFACGACAAYACDGARALRRAALPILVVGSVMASVQIGAATTRAWPIAAFVAGLAGLVTMWLFVRATRDAVPGGDATAPRSLAIAFSAYIALLAVVVVQLWPPVASALDFASYEPTFAATSTGLGWHNPAAAGRRLSLFGHPGALILYASALGYVVYRRSGSYSPGALPTIARHAVAGARVPTVAVFSLVAMATVMTDAGMTAVLGQSLAGIAGGVLPLATPFIGAMGGFATGANTSANLLFGPLVEQAAGAVGVAPTLALAGLSGGAAIGSVLSPAKLVVGASTVGLVGQEGRILKLVVGYGVAIVALLAAVGFAAAKMAVPSP